MFILINNKISKKILSFNIKQILSKYNEKRMKLEKSALQAKVSLTCFYEKDLELIKFLFIELK